MGCCNFILTLPFRVQPRDNGSRFAATDGVSKELSARVRRMQGAHEVRVILQSKNAPSDQHHILQNGFENLPLWIGAVVCS
jgi:hypothetical protein